MRGAAYILVKYPAKSPPTAAPATEGMMCAAATVEEAFWVTWKYMGTVYIICLGERGEKKTRSC